jgi:uncharacterized protein YodC (DUF2158 family)
MAEQKFQKGDTVRLVEGSAAHLMTVQAASDYMVLCAWFGDSGKIRHAPYSPEDLELVHKAPPPAGND